MCSPKGYGFFSHFAHKKGINFGHLGLKWGTVFALSVAFGMLFRGSYFFIIIDKTINQIKALQNAFNIGLNLIRIQNNYKTGLKQFIDLMVRSLMTRVSNFWSHPKKLGKITDFGF